MSYKSEIEWTDATWNPVSGCIKVSPGCAHCYAESWRQGSQRWATAGLDFASLDTYHSRRSA